jgi:hypothetical protein
MLHQEAKVKNRYRMKGDDTLSHPQSARARPAPRTAPKRSKGRGCSTFPVSIAIPLHALTALRSKLILPPSYCRARTESSRAFSS